MSFMDFIQTGIFATFLTLSVTVATCIIDGRHGYRKMKIEKFGDIYACLDGFAEKRAKIVSKCNKMASKLAEDLPEKWDKEANQKKLDKYQDIYHGINEMIEEYSKFLDLFLSFSYFLYRNKPIMPMIKAECWSFLSLYELLMTIDCGERAYKIKYSQIASLIQFIREEGKGEDKKRLREYLSRNQISEYD